MRKLKVAWSWLALAVVAWACANPDADDWAEQDNASAEDAGDNSSDAAPGGSNAGSGGAGSGSGPSDAGSGGSATSEFPYQPPFILGADISITLEDEYWGATYTDDDGQEKPLEEILQRHGFNFIRIDTFVDPSAAGGYAATKAQPFRNLAQTVTLAQRVKARGLGFLLDLHLSDTWTNPGAQTMPASFVGKSGAALDTALHDYVFGAVNALKNAGALPDMVQVGNEITNGFLWEEGRIAMNDFSGFGRLLKVGIDAVHEVDPRIVILLHIEKCNDLATSRWWLNGVLGQGVEFDVLGQSCYAPAFDTDGVLHHPGYQGDPEDWEPVFETLTDEYPELDFVIAEYSGAQRKANDVMYALPEGRGRGSFNWDPTRFYETHPNEPLFEAGSTWNDYIAMPERLDLYDQMAEDYGLR